MKRPCDVTINCPGVDPPVQNYSSEGADPLIFAPGVTGTPIPPRTPTRLDRDPTFYARYCDGTTFSVLSQEIADLLTQLNVYICQNEGSGIAYNEEQKAEGTCPNNSNAKFSYVVVAGLFGQEYTLVGDNPDIDTAVYCAAVQAGTEPSTPYCAALQAANDKALAYAQAKVADFVSRYCVSTPLSPIVEDPPQDPPLEPPGIVPGMPDLQGSPGWVCFGDELDPGLNTYTVTGFNSSQDFTWAIVAGALPVGVDLVKYDHNRAQLMGTPLAIGTFHYTLRATRTDLPYVFAEVTDTLRVFGITSAAPPDATVGTPYSFQLTTGGGSGTVTFTPLFSPPLPPGLSMDSAGLISGTPT